MSVVKLTESTVLQNLSLQCKQNALAVEPDESEWFVKMIFGGITDFLNITKTKSRPIAVKICDLKGNMVAAAIVQYIAAEDDEEVAEGSWNYTWTFSEEDIPENTEAYQITSSQVIEVIARTGYDLARIVFKSPTFISQMAVYLFSIIVDALDQNAPTTEGETWTVEMDGYFEASVAIEDGKKVLALEPKGEMKVRIKDDAASEK